MRQTIRIFFILLALVSAAFAQDGDKVKKDELNRRFREIAEDMKQAYDNGKLNLVIDLYREKCCVKAFKERPVFQKVEEDIRVDIYRLVALSYDDLDDTAMRDKYLEKILDIRPHMESGIYRPSWRIIAREKYIVLPRLMMGVNTGLNITIPNPYNRYSILGPAASTGGDSYPKNYSYNLAHLLGAHISGVIEYTLSKNLSINVQVAPISLAFRYETNLKWESKGKRITLDFIHRQQLYYIEIPLFLKYRFVDIKSRLKPYVQIGGFLRIQEFTHKIIDRTLETESEPPVKDTNAFYLKKLINPINTGFCIGTGITYDTGFVGFRLFFELGVNYKYCFNNIVDAGRRYNERELIFGYYDVFDDIKLRNWDLTFKILFPISFKAFKR